MRRSLGLLVAIACTACSRQLAVGYPSPAPAPAPRVVLAGAPTLGRSSVSETEALDYVLTRVLEIHRNRSSARRGSGARPPLFPVLAERSVQRAGSLSGGEQQMVAVGRALMSRPKLILFDEPSMGLAPVMVLRLFDLIRRVREEGYTILIVEQNVRQVLKLVDRAYLLEVGRIKMEGRAADLAEQDFVRQAYVGF